MFRVADFVYFCFLIMQGKMMLCSHNSLIFTSFPPPFRRAAYLSDAERFVFFIFRLNGGYFRHLSPCLRQG